MAALQAEMENQRILCGQADGLFDLSPDRSDKLRSTQSQEPDKDL